MVEGSNWNRLIAAQSLDVAAELAEAKGTPLASRGGWALCCGANCRIVGRLAPAVSAIGAGG
jgi:hypothetical protein